MDEQGLTSLMLYLSPLRHPVANAATVHSSTAIAIQKGDVLAIHAGCSRAVLRAGRGRQRTAEARPGESHPRHT